jgi:hypothetical protein
MGENGNIVHVFLLSQALDLDTSFFNMTMLHNVKAILREENQFNLLTGFGTNVLHFPYSTISFQNSSN